MGIGCIDLNPSDEKELDELIEDLTIWCCISGILKTVE
jgi:hypothetical protein